MSYRLKNANKAWIKTRPIEISVQRLHIIKSFHQYKGSHQFQGSKTCVVNIYDSSWH